MAVKSVVDIEINDADFQRYAAAFAKYRSELESGPAAWEAIAAASGAAAAAATEMGIQAARASAEVHKSTAEGSVTARNTERQANAWDRMARSATRFTSRVVEATRSLLRWGELTGLISGILGTGGLFGIDRLAISASNQRRNAMGLGATPGEVAGFQTDMARITDPNAFLSKINQGIGDLTSPEYRAMMMAGAHPENQTDAATAAFDTITALKKKVDQIPLGPMFGTVAHAQKLDELMPYEDLKRLREMSQEDVTRYVGEGHRDAKAMELPPSITRAWQDLQVQLHRTSSTLENTFITGLVNLAGPIGRLSAAFTQLVADLLGSKTIKEWIDDLAIGIKWLGDYLSTPKFREDATSFMDEIGELAHKAVDFVKSVASIVDSIADALATIKSWDLENWFSKGGPGGNGPLEDDNPSAPGSPAFERRRHSERFNDDGNDRPSDTREPWDLSGWHAWMPWNWHLQPAAPAPPTAVQKQAFDRLEGQQGLPPGLLNAVMQTESGGNPNATSPAGAMGPFQLMPATAARYGVDNPRDFDQSARGASYFLHDLLTEFHGDLAKAAAGYDWGPGRVEKDVAQYGDRWREHVPMETEKYIERVTGGVQQVKSAPPKAPVAVSINMYNATGGNAYFSASQLAVG
jgi:hypothetical protein